MTANMSVAKRGIDLLRDPQLNKSTAFTAAEREALGLTGLLPAAVDTEETQVQRALQQLGQKPTDLERYIYLIQLLDTDETLFYKVLMSDPARFLPIVYDPTVGEACLKFGHIFRRPRGLYVSLKYRGRVKEVLRNWPEKDVRVICATSGSASSAWAIWVPTAWASRSASSNSTPPAPPCRRNTCCRCTSTSARTTGSCSTTRSTWACASRGSRPPSGTGSSRSSCRRSRRSSRAAASTSRTGRGWTRCVFWPATGTACAVTTTTSRARRAWPWRGSSSALRLTGGKLRDQRVLFLGAGSAGVGIADLIASAMTLEGLSELEARARISLFDVHGLLEPSRTDLYDFQKPYAHPHEPSNDFIAIIESQKPTALIGVSTKGKAFTQAVVEAMARINPRPIIFALSNPTDHAECTAEEAYRWSEGRALYAAGVPFPPVRYGNKTLVPGQGNNLYVFPAVGLAIVATKARRVTDEMFVVAARAVADQVTQAELDSGLLYPPQSNILETEVAVAVKVAETIFARRLAGVEKPSGRAEFRRRSTLQARVHEPLVKT